ncbi:MAG: FAD-dependent oxidoreductase [Planctomycetes bacterium]|nr:FAD-dependent oxidoreductase [Planctomycetota bacterium]
MPSSFDVAVLGGGIAGATAALAARRAGASVIVIRKGIGATSLSSGAIDLVDTLRPGGRCVPVVEAVRWLTEARPYHPLAQLAAGDAGRVVEAYTRAVELLREPLRLAGNATGSGPLLTAAGNWHPGGVYAAAHGPGAMEGLDGARFHVVALDLLPGVVPERLTAALDRRFGAAAPAKSGEAASAAAAPPPTPGPTSASMPAPRAAAPATCSLGELMRLGAPLNASPAILATLFDDPAFAEAFAASCAERVRRFKPTHVVFPPVLGLARSAENLALLEKALEARCFETLSAPPSLPGARLQAALDAALSRAGLVVIDGTATRGVRDTVHVHGPAGESELVARTFVLATGKYLGGGLARNGRVRETLFDLPVFVDGEPLPERTLERYLAHSPGARQPLLAAGVRVDGRLRPMDAAGRPVREGLFAAGAVLDGVDYGDDLGGTGLAMLTGFVAGENAAREVPR